MPTTTVTLQCPTCAEPLLLPVDQDATLDDVASVVEQILGEHAADHGPGAPPHSRLHRLLVGLAPERRLTAVRAMCQAEIGLPDAARRVGTYSIDEVLGSATLYRFWLSARRCTP